MKLSRLLVSLTAVAVVTLPLAAEEAAEDTSPWSGKAGLSYVATSGNTDTQTLGLAFEMSLEPDPWGVDLFATFLRAEQDKELTAERYLAGLRGKRVLNDRFDLFAGLTGEKDEFSGYDFRGFAEAGATYKALTGPEHLLSFDGGLTWTTEDYVDGPDGADGGDNDYFGAILGLAYEWKISETASLTERLLYYPNFDESSDWRASSETALQVAMTSKLALKLGFLWRYQNEPVAGFDDTDTTTTASLVVSF